MIMVILRRCQVSFNTARCRRVSNGRGRPAVEHGWDSGTTAFSGEMCDGKHTWQGEGVRIRSDAGSAFEGAIGRRGMDSAGGLVHECAVQMHSVYRAG